MKSVKKILVLVLSVSMIFSLFTVPVAADNIWDGVTADTSWYSQEGTEFIITTAEELAGLASLVNEGKTFVGKTVKLGNNIALDADEKYATYENVRYGTASYAIITTQYVIDVSANIWTPIGAGVATSNTALSSSTPFAGTFDGQGYTVSGIYTGVTDASTGNTETVQGLFGVVTGTVKNVTTSGCITGKVVLGGVTAYLDGGTAENCTNNAIVFGDGGTMPNGGVENGASRLGAIGGIAGNAMTGSAVNGCVNNADVTCANSNVGGRTGGILGLIDNAAYAVTVKNCLNNGDVDSYQYVGGVIGGNWSEVSPIENCGNTGKVTGFSSGSTRVGGIVSYSASNISSCYNTGDYSIHIGGSAGNKAAHAGGIVSDLMNASTVTNCYNTGSFINAGNATVTTTSLGGICGTGYGSSSANNLINCYTTVNSGHAFEDLANSYAILKTDEYMKTSNFLTELNGTGYAYVADADNINGGYPILKFQYIGSSEDTDWSSVTSFEDGRTYYISSAEDLMAMSALVNAGHSGANSVFALTKDIALDGIDFTAIGTVAVSTETLFGTYTLGNSFSGVFDGDGHTISGLSLEDENGGVALFAYSTGTIRNLTVQGIVTGNYFTAGVVALGSGEIENVVSRVAVTAEGNCVGGILADAVGDITITNCHNRAVITNGGTSSDKSTGRIAGIAGRIDTGYTATIRECSNAVGITGYQYVGGIIGGSFGNVTIDACYNSGNITGVSFGKVYLGGIAGKLEDGTISNCYNTGNLHDAHWSQGHIRAVGGIAGCEENHRAGTAVTNCYSTGTITFNTSNMVSGTNFIYMVGNISGGNSSTASNTMRYANCFYLSGALTIADKNHESYQFWSDVYKSNSLAYDTEDITGCTAEKLKGEEVLAALGGSFVSDETGVNSDYPILYWQVGADVPVVTSDIEIEAVGGTADVTAVTYAVEGADVYVSVTNIQNGKQLKSVTAADASGAKLTVSQRDGYYVFTMPARSVKITVTLENVVTSDNTYALTLPSGLDAIWDIRVDSNYYSGGRVTEGATVTIAVSKEDGAATTSFSGITVQGSFGQAAVMTDVDTVESGVQTVGGARTYAEYTFTMPSGDVWVTLEETYSDLTVSLEYAGGLSIDLKTFTRAEMEALAKSERVYYSGWSSETEALIGRADTAISLLDLLEVAGFALDVDPIFASGDSLVVTAADGMSLTYTYDDLVGTERFYYYDILESGNAAAQRTELTPMLVLKGNIALSRSELGTMVSDTLNTYRFIYGQSEAELTGNVKCVDTMPKCVTSITIVKAVAISETASVTFKTTPQNAEVDVKDENGNAVEPVNGAYVLKIGGTYSYSVSATGYTSRSGSVTPSGDETVEVNLEKVSAYQVTVNPYPKRADVVIRDSDGNAVAAEPGGGYLLADSDYTYEVSKQGYKTETGSFTVSGEDVDLETVTLTAEVNLSRFKDVDLKQWYKNAVEYSMANNLFSGTSETTWEPDMALTRAMFVTVLGKYEGVDISKYTTCEFGDVPDGQWYTAYTQWAYEAKLVAGTGNGNFSPDASITRQEMAVIFYKYVASKDIDMTVSDSAFKVFSDSGDADSWAVTALTWATGKRIMNGDDLGKLRPLGTASRSEAAQIFMVVIENIL